MKRWYVVAEEDSSVLYREVFGPYRSLTVCLEVIPAILAKLKESSDEKYYVEAVHMYERYALALSSEERIEKI